MITLNITHTVFFSFFQKRFLFSVKKKDFNRAVDPHSFSLLDPDPYYKSSWIRIPIEIKQLDLDTQKK